MQNASPPAPMKIAQVLQCVRVMFIFVINQKAKGKDTLPHMRAYSITLERERECYCGLKRVHRS